MKTIFYWVILSIICGFTLTIASCSDDDDVTSLSAPGDIKYSDISSNSFKVTWTADPNATKLHCKNQRRMERIDRQNSDRIRTQRYFHRIGIRK